MIAMKKFKGITYILAFAVLSSLVYGCEPEEEVVPDNKVHYTYLRNCIWQLAAFSDSDSSMPDYARDYDKHIYFSANRLVVMDYDAGQDPDSDTGTYSYVQNYNFKIDSGTNIISVTAGGKSEHFMFHVLCGTHMTLFHKSKESVYVSYRRSAFPDESLIDKESFPDGWWD